MHQAGKLDALLAQDGELLIARRRTASHVDMLEKLLQHVREAQRAGRPASGLREIGRELQGLADQIAADTKSLDLAAAKLSQEIRQVRMLPFTQACDGLDRLVRDLTAGGDKDVSLTIGGGEIGVDRSILEGFTRSADASGTQRGRSRHRAQTYAPCGGQSCCRSHHSDREPKQPAGRRDNWR